MESEKERRIAAVKMIADDIAGEARFRDEENLIRELHNVLLEVGLLVGAFMRDGWLRELEG